MASIGGDQSHGARSRPHAVVEPESVERISRDVGQGPVNLSWWARLYLWTAERLYHELAWAYDLASWVVSLGRWHMWRGLALDYIVGQRVLEIGFGTGGLLVQMARRGCTVYGLDASREMQRMAGRKLQQAGVSVPRVRADARAMPFQAACFDTVISTFPSRYITSPALLAEVARVLKRGDPATGQAPGRMIAILGVRWMAPRRRQPAKPAPMRATDAESRWLARAVAATGMDGWIVVHELGRIHVPVIILENHHVAGAEPASAHD